MFTAVFAEACLFSSCGGGILGGCGRNSWRSTGLVRVRLELEGRVAGNTLAGICPRCDAFSRDHAPSNVRLEVGTDLHESQSEVGFESFSCSLDSEINHKVLAVENGCRRGTVLHKVHPRQAGSLGQPLVG